jgi:hypothetical protein
LRRKVRDREADESTRGHADVKEGGPIPQHIMRARRMIDHMVWAQVDDIEFRISGYSVS